MSDRPTPETDAWLAEEKRNPRISGLGPWLGYCQQLERERDEERQEVSAQKEAINATIVALHKTTTERNDALQLARELRDALTEVMRVSAPHMRRIGDTHIIKVADATIQKAKEVLP